MKAGPDYLGKHNWEPMPGRIIVCFELHRKTWAGKPSRSGWDNVIKSEVVERYANCQDAEKRETELLERNEPNISYLTLPLQVKKPTESSRPRRRKESGN